MIVYSQRIREAFKGVPLVIGGIEASLRRIAHFDYWSEKVRRSVLLDAKADPNFRDRRGDCPLHLACMFNRAQVVKALLEHGADPTLKNAAGELPTKIASVTLRMKIDKFQSTGKF